MIFSATSKFQPWPTAIVAVLAAQVCFGIWMTRVARNDPHFAIEPDYYARAVNWDSTMAQARRDQALGWHAEANMLRREGPSAELTVALTDSTGAVVQVDSITAEALAVANAGQIDRLVLTPDASGYHTAVNAAASGLWEVQVRAHRGRDLYTAKLRTELR